MERRALGRTGVQLSVLGFGCGNVGGLMVRGSPEEQERAIARATDLGINYFDTAPIYGDTLSEQNLGRALRAARGEVVVGTKFRLPPIGRGRIASAIETSLDESLRRLGRTQVDLLQLHNPISSDGRERTVDSTVVLEDVIPALERLRGRGKIRFYGITALGDTAALHRVIDARAIDSAQVCYNLLNPSAGAPLPPNFPAQDFGRLLSRAREAAVGVIGIRVLAAGALSGAEARHPVAVPAVDPIASGPDYRSDVERARRLEPLVREGHVASLIEAALRFAIGHEGMTTVLVGYSSLEHLEYAAQCVGKGPLPRAALDRLAELWREIATA